MVSSNAVHQDSIAPVEPRGLGLLNREVGLIALCLLAVACSPYSQPVPDVVLKEVPAMFRGHWEMDIADCREGGPLKLVIGAKEMTFVDSHIEIVSVAPDGADAATVDGEFKGGGETWDGTVRLELADGGDTLNVVNGAQLKPRVKCP